MFRRSALLALGIVLAVAAQADTLRIASWNISNYNGGRTSDLQNAVYGTFQGRQFAPDVLFGQEILSDSAAISMRNALNSAAGSPGDWAYWNNGVGGNNQNVFFYRTSRVNGVASTLIAAGTTTTNPRDLYRFDFQITGNANGEIVSVYNTHMKSGQTQADEDRRLIEANLVRLNANSLASGFHPVVLGDFNMRTGTEQAYQTMTASTGNDRGRFFDPIGTSGTWYQQSSKRFVHTQDPSGTGGMDDRHDQILMASTYNDGVGLEYVGMFGTAYSTTTWNDPNHSYRAWGNDGTSYNTSLTITGNTMVGDSIAQSLVNVATVNGGHLPVFADLQYTAVPEPASMVALGAGLLALTRRRRNRN
ncbi:MAG: PEP-CTERM sorting domain-containing protein [Fimbriimonadaceae bacterium]|nr:PEP-CTERM sorting domain-containing protein [Fimbriimonadaceae bacterium]